MQKEETVPKALRWLENDLGSIARYIWLNVKDKFQREIHLRALLGDAYAHIQDEIENDLPCSVQDVSIREMSASAYGRELYNAQLFLLKDMEKLVKNQQIQEARAERAERAMSLLMERLQDQEQAISKIQCTVENIACVQSKLSGEFKENQVMVKSDLEELSGAIGKLQRDTTERSVKIIDRLDTNSEKLRNLNDLVTMTVKEQEQLMDAIGQLQTITVKEQKRLMDSIEQLQGETTQRSQRIIEEIRANRQGAAELHEISIKAEQEQRKLSAAIQQVQAEIRQKTDTISEKLENDSQAVAELKAVTIAAEKEQKSLSAKVLRIQESLNGIIENTSEMKRKQDFYAMKVREDKRKFEKFIGRWKLVKREWDGVEKDISNRIVQSHSFEPVAEGVMWKQYRKDGSEWDSSILTTDEEIKNKLEKEGKNCDLVEFQTDGSFKWVFRTYNVEGNHLIERWPVGFVLTYEKC